MNFHDDFDVGFESFDSPIPVVDPPPVEKVPSTIIATPKIPKPGRKKLKFYMTEAHAKILAELTHFRPAATLQTIEDVYRNLVVFEGNFEQTCHDFRKLGAGMLTIQQEGGRGEARCWIKAGQFVLAEALGSSSKMTKMCTLDVFHQNAKMYCYRLKYLKEPNALENQVRRRPNEFINTYKNVIKKFKRESIDQELVFSAEFTKLERAALMKYARKLDLKAFAFGPNNSLQLKIIGLPIPALAIVERILVRKDHKLRALYRVIPPMVGARQIGEFDD